MGSSSSKQKFWPQMKLFNREQKHKNSKKRHSKRGNVDNPPPVAPMYDTVADYNIPVYSVVNNKQPNNFKVEENVQYAEIEVIRQPVGSSKKPPISPKPATTEYATLNFPPQGSPPPTTPKKPQSPRPRINTNEYRSPRKYNAANGTLV